MTEQIATKECLKCNQVLPVSAFSKHPQAKLNLRPDCKKCRAAFMRKKRSGPEGKAKVKNINLKHTYGITKTEWDELLEAQGNKCALCGTDNPVGRGWQTDHDHTNGKIRGILCVRCNTGLGLFIDSPELLWKAMCYITDWWQFHEDGKEKDDLRPTNP